MLDIQENIQLAPYTTFYIGGPARFFAVAQNEKDITVALTWAKQHGQEVFILGGGSNVLISDEGFPGLVIQIKPLCLKVINEDVTEAELEIGAGEIWDKVVEFTVKNDFWGIENLSHIPGFSGAFVVQNVGAYGQEASKVVKHVTVLNRESLQIERINATDCQFTYRHSSFNTAQKNRYVILSANIMLSKVPKPDLTYGDVKEYFAIRKLENPSQQQIRQAIIEIRNKKFLFPDKPERGNTGSFFRGKILNDIEFTGLGKMVNEKFGNKALQRLETMTDRLKVPQGFKTPTAFVLELCEVKGLHAGGAKINETQPAIVVNSTGKATANDVIALARQVLKEVKEKTGISLELEPELVGFPENILGAG